MNESALKNLLKLMAELRDLQSGCPWNQQQTLQSLTPYTLEEVHEVIQAIESNDCEKIKEELGDLLFQIICYAQIASEDKQFDFNDVVENLIEKIKRRHPHVFEKQQTLNAEQLKHQWDKIKSQEQNQSSNAFDHPLEKVPGSMPSLAYSQKLQKAAVKYGVKLPNQTQLTGIIQKELKRLNQQTQHKDRLALSQQMGDLLLSCVSLSQALNVDAEQSLRLANQRFKKTHNRALKTNQLHRNPASSEDAEQKHN